MLPNQFLVESMALPPQLIPVHQDAAPEPVLEPDEPDEPDSKEAELVAAGIETEAEVTKEVELEMATEDDMALAEVVGAVLSLADGLTDGSRST